MTDVTPRRAEGAKRELEVVSISLEGIEEKSRQFTSEADLAHAQPEILHGIGEWAEATVELGHGYDFEPDTVLGRRMLQALEDRTRERRTAKTRLTACQDDLEQEQELLSQLPRGLTGWRLVVLGTLLSLVALATILGVGGLLGPTIDEYVLRTYIVGVLHRSAALSAQLSFTLSLILAAGLVLPGTVAIVAAGGHLSWGLKLGFLSADVLFSSAFALVRIGVDGLSAPNIAWSVFEGALLCGHVVFLMAVSPTMARLARERREYLVHASRAAAAEQKFNRAEREFEQAFADELAQSEVLQRRGECAIELARKKQLARLSAQLAALVSQLGLRSHEANSAAHPTTTTENTNADETAL